MSREHRDLLLAIARQLAEMRVQREFLQPTRRAQ